ncbi:hypothetical protein M0811_09489 [Anaeramoeba ignava]|uniref:Uncharacterized protein n=1 Tax=Anaeramoeba ignava TaxID=1746090 RepID=A0A9Q0LGS0_ANAIG|nr:hypothetical protein M0811_09489 [Anaeramoeba ignava]
MQSIKCVVIGDSGAGKTAMLLSYTKNEFPSEHNLTSFEKYKKVEMVKKKQFELHFYDTSSQQDYEQMRIDSYQGASFILICFSLISPSSFENIKSKWISEINHFAPNVPIILIGNKLDLRNDQETINQLDQRGLTPINYEQAFELSVQINAWCYMECSALTQEGLKAIFDEVIQIFLNPKKAKKNAEKLRKKIETVMKKKAYKMKKEEEFKARKLEQMEKMKKMEEEEQFKRAERKLNPKEAEKLKKEEVVMKKREAKMKKMEFEKLKKEEEMKKKIEMEKMGELEKMEKTNFREEKKLKKKELIMKKKKEELERMKKEENEKNEKNEKWKKQILEKKKN